MNQAVAQSEFLPGDIFACWGTDWISRGITFQTSCFTWPIAPRGLKWSPSHVAIACPGNPLHLNDRCIWVESTTLSRRDCIINRKRVSGCQAHTITSRLSDYVNNGGRVDVYRLTPMNQLQSSESDQLRKNLIQLVRDGVEYDMASALFSGTRLIRALDKIIPFWDAKRHRVFCSQLIAGVLQANCRMNRDDPERYNPGRLLRMLVRQGVYRLHRTIEQVKS